MIHIAAHRAVLQRLNLHTLDGVRSFRGELVKDQRGRRDILRIQTTDEAGAPLILFLKRIYKPYKKDGLRSLLKRGKVWSLARQEWENMLTLNRSGFPTAELIAFGEDLGPFWERFSFILTKAAPAPETVEEFLQHTTNPTARRALLTSLAHHIRAMHDAGLASPDLFARHFFVAATPSPVGWAPPTTPHLTACDTPVGWASPTNANLTTSDMVGNAHPTTAIPPSPGIRRPSPSPGTLGEGRGEGPDSSFILHPSSFSFYLIDMARLDRKKTTPLKRRARDLAALHVSVPMRHASRSERRRFLCNYSADALRHPPLSLLPLILFRTKSLLKRSKFKDFSEAASP